jgi:hypothetical protein
MNGVSDATWLYDGGRSVGELDVIMSSGVTLTFGVGGRTVEEEEASASFPS